jgi:hypothetical protein
MRKRYKPGYSSPGSTWLRSAYPNYANGFWYVNTYGGAFNGNANYAYGVWFGFSIHRK